MGTQSNNDSSPSKPGQQSPVLSVKSANGTPPGTPPPPYTLAARIASRAEKIKGSDLDLAAKIAKEAEANAANSDKCSQFYLKHEFKAYLQRFISPESDKYYSYYFWSRYLILILSLVLFILLLGYFSLLYGSSQADNSKNLDNGSYGIAYPLLESESRLPSAQAHVMSPASETVSPVTVARPSETTTTETVATNNVQDNTEKISSTQSSESTESPEAVENNDSQQDFISPFHSLLPKANSISLIMKSIAQSVDGTREPVVKVIESHRNNVTPTDVRQLTSNFMSRMIQILQAFANRDEQPQRYSPETPEVAESESDYDDEDDDILPHPYRLKLPTNNVPSNSEMNPFSSLSNDENPKSVILFVRRDEPQSYFGQAGQSSAVNPLLQAIAAIARQASQQNAMEQSMPTMPQPQVQRVMMIVRQDEPEEAESEAEPQIHMQHQPIMFQRPAPFIHRLMESRREYGIPMMAQPQVRQIVRIPQPTTHMPIIMQRPQIPLLALMRMRAAAAQMQLPPQPQPQEHEYEAPSSVFPEPLPRQAMIILRKNSEMSDILPQEATRLYEMFRPENENTEENEQNEQPEPEYPTINFVPEQPKEPEVNPTLNAYRLDQWSQYNQAVKDISENSKNMEQPEEAAIGSANAAAAAQPTETESESVPQQYSPENDGEKQTIPLALEVEENITQSEPTQEQPVEQRQPVADSAEPSSSDAKNDEQSQQLPAEPRISRE